MLWNVRNDFRIPAVHSDHINVDCLGQRDIFKQGLYVEAKVQSLRFWRLILKSNWNVSLRSVPCLLTAAGWINFAATYENIPTFFSKRIAFFRKNRQLQVMQGHKVNFFSSKNDFITNCLNANVVESIWRRIIYSKISIIIITSRLPVLWA